jgi:malate dehydrogenase (oxaloacetate-decarboxylating)(NADP+)
VIRSRARSLNLDLEDIQIVDMANSPRRDYYLEDLYRLRHRKGVTRAEAISLITDRNIFASLMVHAGDADAMISGLTTHYPDTVRPALQVIPMRHGIRKVSGLYLVITAKGRLYFFADCTVNGDPTSEELAEIAECAAGMARRFNVEPRVALLSYSNFGSARLASARRVRRAVDILHERVPDLIVDGEMQADTALRPELLAETYPFSPLRGGANVLVFPNLDAGNIAYKLLASIGGAQVIGPVLMGLSKPVHVLQRGASVDDIVNMAALAVVEAQDGKAVKR